MALKCLTPELTDVQRDQCNEPTELGQLIIRGDTQGAWQWVEDNIGKLPLPVIKSPHLSFAMRDQLKRRGYHVVCTRRHVSAIARSMLRYEDSRRIELCNQPYWHHYAMPPCWPTSIPHRAFVSAWAHFSSAIQWADEVWEYGMWAKWPNPNNVKFRKTTDLEALFDRNVNEDLTDTPMWFWQELNDTLYNLWKARHA